MQYAAFGLFALAFLGIAWWVTRLMNSSKRNDGATHGASSEGSDAWFADDSMDTTGHH
jgi:hypothetical protein